MKETKGSCQEGSHGKITSPKALVFNHLMALWNPCSQLRLVG